MPLPDAANLVARFLQANNYTQTLDAFLEEAGLPFEASSVKHDDGLTIEKLLEEKRSFDKSISFERTEGSGVKVWSRPSPSIPTVINLPDSANVLHVSVSPSPDPSMSPVLLTTTASRSLHILDTPSLRIQSTHSALHDAPILWCETLSSGRLSLTTSMSGRLLLYDHVIDKPLSVRNDHKKYVIKVVTHAFNNETYIATAGWDAAIHLYILSESSEGTPTLSEPQATLTLPTNPEDLLFVTDPDDPTRLILTISRHDSTSLHYYQVGRNPSPKLKSIGRQNLAPHSNAWVTFSPSSIALCPTDPTLIAVATSSVPHLKLLIVRLLLPRANPIHVAEPASQVAQTRAKLAVQDREDAAMRISVNTMAPQTAYSTPKVVWRPDGSGVWVNGEDGLVRGLETGSGKVVQVLEGGHEGNVKIRSLWAGVVDGKEWLVSGGFDRRVVVWRVE